MAQARSVSQGAVRALGQSLTEGRTFGTLRMGKPRINALKRNLALEELK